ncbi:MAG: hypothetical protein JWL93_1371 [Hyphomicrobiales bacterium]|jgi:hypothetical protein|nr:hypothetical protein [Hyphomicrobiales bacterium]
MQIRIILCLAWAALGASGPAFAGGADLEAIMGDTEHGAPFFGEVLDIKSRQPIEGVRIRAQLKGAPLPLFVNTNDEGRFSMRGFGKGIDPAQVSVSCELSGYELIDLSRRRVSKDPEAATEIECLFEKR